MRLPEGWSGGAGQDSSARSDSRGTRKSCCLLTSGDSWMLLHRCCEMWVSVSDSSAQIHAIVPLHHVNAAALEGESSCSFVASCVSLTPPSTSTHLHPWSAAGLCRYRWVELGHGLCLQIREVQGGQHGRPPLLSQEEKLVGRFFSSHLISPTLSTFPTIPHASYMLAH